MEADNRKEVYFKAAPHEYDNVKKAIGGGNVNAFMKILFLQIAKGKMEVVVNLIQAKK